MILWMAFDTAGILAGGRAFVHYFISLAPSLSAVAAIAYWYLSQVTPAFGSSLKASLAALIVGPMVLVQSGDAVQLIEAAPDPALAATAAQRSRIQRWQMASDYIKRVKRPEDTLFTWDYMPWVYSQTELSSSIRYPSAHYLKDSSWAYERLGPEMLLGLREKPPTFIIIDGDDPRGDFSKSPKKGNYYLQFVAFVHEHYERAYSIPQLNVYRILENR
jgi:hypothetical protein